MRQSWLALSVLAVLAACTPMRWEHPQLGLAAADDDLRECSIRARQEVWRYSFMRPSWGYPFAHGYSYRDRNGRLRYAEPVFPPYRDTTFDEWNLRDYCMRSKGYKLVPVPEQTASASG